MRQGISATWAMLITFLPNAHNFTTIFAQNNQVPQKDELSKIKNMHFFI
jgi:hypothetical protein